MNDVPALSTTFYPYNTGHNTQNLEIQIEYGPIDNMINTFGKK